MIKAMLMVVIKNDNDVGDGGDGEGGDDGDCHER